MHGHTDKVVQVACSVDGHRVVRSHDNVLRTHSQLHRYFFLFSFSSFVSQDVIVDTTAKPNPVIDAFFKKFLLFKL